MEKKQKDLKGLKPSDLRIKVEFAFQKDWKTDRKIRGLVMTAATYKSESSFSGALEELLMDVKREVKKMI